MIFNGVEFYVFFIVNGEIWYLVVNGFFFDFVFFDVYEIGCEFVQCVFDVGVFVLIVYFGWYGLIFEDVFFLLQVYVVEVFNLISDKEIGWGDGGYLIDQFFNNGCLMGVIVIDDVYCYLVEVCCGWVMVKV